MSTDTQANTRDSVPYVLRALANVWDNWCGLPEPIGMWATNNNGIVTVQVAELAAVKAWNEALAGTDEPTTSLYTDRGPIHGVFVWGWHGWNVQITADEFDAPPAAEEATLVHPRPEAEPATMFDDPILFPNQEMAQSVKRRLERGIEAVRGER